jgi:DNA-binding response OmpR family regulator
MICPSCGAPTESTITRHGLVVHSDPPRVNYRGRRLDLTRKQAQVMEKLIRFDEAPFEVLEGEGSRSMVRATIDQLRRRLPPDVRINSVYGWGYRLEVASAAMSPR